MPKSNFCMICKLFDKYNDECSKDPFESQYGPQCESFIKTSAINNELPKKWKSSDVRIPVHVILNPMSVLTDPKRIMKIEMGD